MMISLMLLSKEFYLTSQSKIGSFCPRQYSYGAVKNKKAVSAYFTSEQILHFDFAEQNSLEHIDAFNAGLSVLCRDKGCTFIDNDTNFRTCDGSITAS